MLKFGGVHALCTSPFLLCPRIKNLKIMEGMFIAFVLVSAVASLASDYVKNVFNEIKEN